MLVNTGLRAFAPPPSGGDVTNFLLNCAANVAPLQRLTLARMHAPLVAAGALDPTVPVEGALHFLLSLLHHLHRGSSGSRPRTLRLIGATRLRGAHGYQGLSWCSLYQGRGGVSRRNQRKIRRRHHRAPRRSPGRSHRR